MTTTPEQEVREDLRFPCLQDDCQELRPRARKGKAPTLAGVVSPVFRAIAEFS
jgi:hypothetical protein